MYLIARVVILIMPNPFFPSFPFYHYSSPRIPRQPYSNPIPTKSLPTPDTLPPEEPEIPREEPLKKEPFFELFGLELFFDDILLVCLIFFLYSEGVKDEMLFIALILLLLS